MLLTVLHIGGAPYAIEATHIVEVLPLLQIQPIPHAPVAIAGLCNYRGTATPVIDLDRLAGLPPAPRLMSTRLLLVRHLQTQFALLAGGITETLKIAADQFVPAPLEGHQPAWLGPMAPHGTAFVRRIELEPLAREIGALT